MRFCFLSVAAACFTVLGVVAEEAGSATCGSLLLQVQAGSPPAPQAKGWLGWGRWIGKEDFWSFKHTRSGESVFTPEIPDSCFTEAACGTVHSSEFKDFSSVEEWSQHYSSSFSIGAGGGYGGFSGSIDASVGQSVTSMGTASRRLSVVSKTFKRKCFRLIRSDRCAYNRTYLQTQFLHRLETLPQGKPYDEEKMQSWKASFIERFGTHISMTSSHGSHVQALASIVSRTTSASDCNTLSLCFGFEWAAGAKGGLELCSKSNQCDNTSSTSQSQTLKCAALGGDSAFQNKVCDSGTPESIFDKWEEGGDLDSASSAIGYHFLPISEFITNMDHNHEDIAQTLAKAVEYSNCLIGQKPPVQEWINETCKCVRRCENGGTLHPATCTCSCPGNAQHGFNGPTCAGEYGKCQPGVGTGNLGAARRCPVNNACSSWYSQHKCKATDVCCATNFGTACCPYGNSCQCSANECRCIRPRG